MRYAALVGLLLCLPTLARGHVDIDPRQSLPNVWATYTLNVPTETGSATIQVRLMVPREFEIEMIGHSQVWQITSVRDERGYVREITWSGSRIPPQRFEELKILARTPTAPGTYVWKIEQSYEDGSVAPWEAQTLISATEGAGTRRVDEAWRASQIATTVSLVAIGIALVLIIVTVIGIVRHGRVPAGSEPL